MIAARIRGVPYSQARPAKGDRCGPSRWSDAIVDQTKDLPKLDGPCFLRVTFYLSAGKAPSDYPFGNDLDNLLKRFNDALKKTVLSQAPGQDSAIVFLEASKVLVNTEDEAGAAFELYPLEGMRPRAAEAGARRPAVYNWPPGYFEGTAGRLADQGLERPAQGALEVRESLE